MEKCVFVLFCFVHTTAFVTIKKDNQRRARAFAAMEEMRKRAARYREKPQEVDELASQMEGLEVGCF